MFLRGLKRKGFSPYNKISVCFTNCSGQSEGAINKGGPTREMFRLLMDHIKNRTKRNFLLDPKIVNILF